MARKAFQHSQVIKNINTVTAITDGLSLVHGSQQLQLELNETLVDTPTLVAGDAAICYGQ